MIEHNIPYFSQKSKQKENRNTPSDRSCSGSCISGERFILGHIVDLVDGDDSNKCCRIRFADIVHQLAVLLLVHNGNDFLPFRVVECANAVIDRGTAVQIVQNKMQDFIMLLRKNARRLMLMPKIKLSTIRPPK